MLPSISLAHDFLFRTVYSNIGKKFPLEYASTILACLSVLVTAPLYYFYMNGEKIRKRSKFASEIAEKREERAEARKVKEKGGGGAAGESRETAMVEDTV